MGNLKFHGNTLVSHCSIVNEGRWTERGRKEWKVELKGKWKIPSTVRKSRVIRGVCTGGRSVWVEVFRAGRQPMAAVQQRLVCSISWRCLGVSFHSFHFALLRCFRFRQKIKAQFLAGPWCAVGKRNTLKTTNRGGLCSVGWGSIEKKSRKCISLGEEGDTLFLVGKEGCV